MLLGIVSDPHGNSYGLQAALSALDGEGVDQIVCAGDVIGYYPFVNETITLLRDRGVPCIAGDDMILAARGGVIWRISTADGKEQGKADAGCPLGTGPVLVGGRLIVGGSEGSVLEVKKP